MRVTDAPVIRAAIDGRAIDTRRYRLRTPEWTLWYWAPSDSGALLNLILPVGSKPKLEVLAYPLGIPKLPGVTIPPRPANMVPVQSGDVTIVCRRFSIPKKLKVPLRSKDANKTSRPSLSESQGARLQMKSLSCRRGCHHSYVASLRQLVEIFDERHGRAVKSLYFRVCRFDDVVLIRRVCSTAMTESEMTGGKLQRFTCEHVARIRAG